MPPDPAPPRRIGVGLVVFAVFVVGMLNLAALGGPRAGVLDGRLVDPDAYLRLIRVLELNDGLGWYHVVTGRLAAPDGLFVHWTRPLDLLILLPARAIAALSGQSLPQALTLVGILVSPLLHVAAAVAAAAAAARLWGGLAPWYAVLMAVATPAATGYSMLGRADHHTLLLLALMLGLGAALRALAPPAPPRAALVAGACFGAGIWVSPEALIIAMPVLAATGLAAMIAAEGRGLAAQGLRLALGMAGVVLLAIAVERPPAAWLETGYDKVSVHHLVLALLVAAVFAAARALGDRPRGARIAGAGVAALLALGTLLLLFPDALGGSLSAGDAVANDLFHPTVEEMQPLPPFGPGSWKLLPMNIGGPVLAGILALALAAPAWRRDGRWPAGLALGLALVAALVAALAARRFALDLAAPAAIASAGLSGLILHGARPAAAAARAGLAALALFATLGLPFIGLVGEKPPASTAFADAALEAGCDPTAMTRWLAVARPGVSAATPDPVLLAADIYLGPELAWRTPYRAVAGPYHRGGAAIGDTVAVLEARDEATARGVLARRQATLLLVCRAAPEVQVPDGSLAAALVADRPPAWLVPVPLPPGLAGYRLYAVSPQDHRP